jgi:hypothetical protein
MKKLLLASVLAIASFPGQAVALDINERTLDDLHTDKTADADKELRKRCNNGMTAACEYACARETLQDGEVAETPQQQADYDRCVKRGASPPARVTVTPPYQGPPPIGWVFGPYTSCANPPQCSMGVVNVQADGLNVRAVPNGLPVMALVNGTPFYPLQRQVDWLLVAPACDLTPTWAWSWNAGVPLNRCWVYF